MAVALAVGLGVLLGVAVVVAVAVPVAMLVACPGIAGVGVDCPAPKLAVQVPVCVDVQRTGAKICTTDV